MSLRCVRSLKRGSAAALFAVWLLFAASPCSAAPAPLRICADPNNLPFSDRQGGGYENRIAELLARDSDTTVQYSWWPQRRGFLRNTLGADLCDILIGVPQGAERVLTTKPYYRSTYVFVTRRDDGLDPRSLDAQQLRSARVGVQLIGDDFANTPPAHALSRRGIIDNVIGYPVYGDYAANAPAARIVAAVADGKIDIALVWGPVGGYFAKLQQPRLSVAPIEATVQDRGLPFTFAMAMGVRPGNTALRDALDSFIERRQAQIDEILHSYNVPLVTPPGQGQTLP
jgi:quinoprotein dehydrogenase-associated probable ABC transporter substrate-binding protein